MAEFLFGADRGALIKLAGSLMEMQRGACFYCDRRISTAGHVDHFVKFGVRAW